MISRCVKLLLLALNVPGFAILGFPLHLANCKFFGGNAYTLTFGKVRPRWGKIAIAKVEISNKKVEGKGTFGQKNENSKTKHSFYTLI